MRPSGILVSVVCAFVALGLTVWIGRYRAETPSLASAILDPEKPIGPPIAETGPYPKVSITETEYNFGTMTVGSEGEHKFVIENVGEADLELMARKEDTTCSCTFGELSKDGKIPPGDSVEVTLKWTIKQMQDVFRHRALVRTNDPEHKEVELVVTGKVDQALKLKPESPWSIGELSADAPSQMQGAVYSAVLDSFQLTEAKSEAGTVDVEIKPMTEEQLQEYGAKSGYILVCSVGPDVSIGPYSDTVNITTDVEGATSLAFEISGSRSGPLELFGPGFKPEANALLLGEFPARTGKTATISVYVRDFEQDLELVKAEQTFDSVELELTKDKRLSGNTQRYLLKVTVPPGDPQDRVRKKAEKINLFFNHPQAEKIRIYVEFLAI